MPNEIDIESKAELEQHEVVLTLDPETAHRNLRLTENDHKLEWQENEEMYESDRNRFKDSKQVLCTNVLTRENQYYWEVEWKGQVVIGVAYKEIIYRDGDASKLGFNDRSWSLHCDEENNLFLVRHDEKETVLPVTPSDSTRVGVYLDYPGGALSFYSVSCDTLTLLHTFQAEFTGKPLYPGFGVRDLCSYVSLPGAH